MTNDERMTNDEDNKSRYRFSLRASSFFRHSSLLRRLALGLPALVQRNAERVDLRAQRCPVNAEDAGALGQVALGMSQHTGDQMALGDRLPLGVQVLRAGAKP